MMEALFKWLRKAYNKFIHSIAFLPAILGAAFLLFAIGMTALDEEGWGGRLNERFTWLTLQDPSTARTIVATVAAGIISLAVFSFSMVMIVMNQAASQMSNRMLDNIIGDRIQKTVLGFYVGTIIYSLYLLTHISELKESVSVPSLSVYILLVLTIFDIFLFVYFLHYITQSFRYEQLIQRIHDRTGKRLQKVVKNKRSDHVASTELEGRVILSRESGYYQGYDESRLLKIAVEADIKVELLHTRGTYVLKGTPLLKIEGEVEEDLLKRLLLTINFYYGQEIDKNAYYGFFHLTEVAVKALSPGINDPGTAVLSLHALTDLLATVMKEPIDNEVKDSNGEARIFSRQLSFEALFDATVLPVWDYGKKDRKVQEALVKLLEQLQFVDEEERFHSFFKERLEMVQKEIKKFSASEA